MSRKAVLLLQRMSKWIS